MTIEQIITQKFNEDNFLKYINNTLGLKSEYKQKEFVKIDEELSYKTIVDTKKDTNESLVTIFKRKKSVANARVMFNKVVEKIVKNRRDDFALLATYSEDDPSIWKLSLVVFDSINNELKTNSKRYTHEVGVNIPIKTALTQLEKLNENSTLDDFLEAFSVEKLSDDFFREYKNLFYTLVDDILVVIKKNRPKIQKDSYEAIKDTQKVKTYIKKMMGRIVFLYFVQKKEWLDKNPRFLSDLFSMYVKQYNKEAFKLDENDLKTLDIFSERFLKDLETKNNIVDKIKFETVNIYDKVIEQLFINGLNTREDIWKAFDGKEFKIPYLNGGLFEADTEDNLDLAIPNKDLIKIFAFFNRYNFTIIEDTSHDSEVAVDPEMLGRVFEDLLEDRKDKGAFYTPREIVHYMCLQSLENYIQTKKPKNEKEELEYLKQIKILDLAIGSGAFPMGMLHEIVQKRIECGDKSKISDIKKEVIQNSIYGIDIEPSAVEIAKLRFWLSIVVDEEKPTPLPNLFYKIMVGNSLVETIEGIDPLRGKKEEDLQELDKLFKEYYNEHKDKKGKENQIKEKLKVLFKTLENKYSSQSKLNYDDRNNKNDIEIQKANNIRNILKDLREKHYSDKVFLYKLFFRDVLKNGGFDIVIGNPPYITEKDNKSAFDDLKAAECYQGKTDIWHIFVCKGIDLLKYKGTLSFIAKNHWLASSSASKMRYKLYEKTNIKQIIDFGSNLMFESADVQTMILLVQKDIKNIKHKISYKKYEKQETKTIKQELQLGKIDFTINEIEKKYDVEKNLTFSTVYNETILEKIEDKRNFIFDSKKEIIQGIIGGPDKAFIISKDQLDNFLPNEKKFIKMLHTNTKAFYTSDSDKYIFYISKHNFVDKCIENYPNIKEQLLNFENQLQNRREVLKGSIKWFHLWWARDEFFFKKGAKLVWAKRTEGKKFTYTEKPFYGTANLFFVKSDRINLKYLTALLNSKLFYFYMKHRLKHTGDLLQIDKNQFLKIPIYLPDNTNSFEILVDDIISLKKKINEQDKTKNSFKNKIDRLKQLVRINELENKIDKMVYNLYKLSKDEIKIVEESIKD